MGQASVPFGASLLVVRVDRAEVTMGCCISGIRVCSLQLPHDSIYYIGTYIYIGLSLDLFWDQTSGVSIFSVFREKFVIDVDFSVL